LNRSAGILLHPTSLPGPHGVGDLGPEAHRFVAFLAEAAQTLWQVLPLGPTGYGDSPYQPFSTFAGNPLLISPETLAEEGLLKADDLSRLAPLPAGPVDYGAAIARKFELLDHAWVAFAGGAAPALRGPFDTFRSGSPWFDDFARFMAIKESHGGRSWQEWPDDLRHHEPGALAAADRALHDRIDAHRFRQFLFERQWSALRARCREARIEIVGDVPIFVALDSAEVWANPELFELDDARRPTVVAGVPPDYFSATGQLWGNPLYRWDAHVASRFRWWVERLRSAIARTDLVRLDHFRGLEACWEVPAAAVTAEHGRWVPAPGAQLLEALERELGSVPIIAEDLGVITPAVEALRDRFGLPGMKVLQFAFGTDRANPFLPSNYSPRCVVYTGTHDNDTTRGWYEESSTPEERDFARRYLGRDGSDIVWDLIRLAHESVAERAIVPLQDVLDLGSSARMNLPGRPSGNWAWRFEQGQLTDAHAARLRDLTTHCGRRPS